MGEIAVGQSYTGDELIKLVGVDPDSFREERAHIVVENKDQVIVAVDVGNDNWEVTYVFSKDKVFYSLCEEDILEVANALGEELTPDEMTQAKSAVADGVSEHWWDVTEDVIGDILVERRKSDGRG